MLKIKIKTSKNKQQTEMELNYQKLKEEILIRKKQRKVNKKKWRNWNNILYKNIKESDAKAK